MSFVEKLKETANVSMTENGALGYNTTGKALLDLNFRTSSFRYADEETIINSFMDAFYEDRRLAIKWLIYASDIRGGLGERRLFRVCLSYLAVEQPEIVKAILPLIPEYNRWDSILVLLDTQLKDDVLNLIWDQLAKDLHGMAEKKPISLLAKWLPSINASSHATRAKALTIIKEFEMSAAFYRRQLSKLRAYLNVVETLISAGKWNEINYEGVPSQANLKYKDAFLRHDSERRIDYLQSLTKGEAKINSSVVFPHDIVHKYVRIIHDSSMIDITLEEMWETLPDYVKGEGKTICVADGSASMAWLVTGHVRALDVANALAVYFSERCMGEFKDKYITFSRKPKLVDFSGARNLREKLQIALRHSECENTDIEAVFDLILKTAVKHNLKQEEIPQNILILSDMEFDCCAVNSNNKPLRTVPSQKKLFSAIADRYKVYGYSLPRLIFWNLGSRTGTIPIVQNGAGVALVSGFSPTVMNMVLSSRLDPYECLVEQLNAARYDAVDKALYRNGVSSPML